MIWLFAVVIAIIAASLLFERWVDSRLFTAAPGQACANLGAAQAGSWLRDHPETQVLDVRSPAEFAGGALPHAVNIPLDDESFAAKADALDRSRPVLVYCAGGFRSRKAIPELKRLAFKNILHLHRGYLSWRSVSGKA